jgi:hypothetical protein
VRAPSHAIAFVALTAAALAGCGSSASSNSLTHAQLVSRADAICKQANERIEAVKKLPPLGASPYGPVLGLLREELPIFTAEVGALQRLKPSSPDREAFGEYVSAATAELATAGRVRDASAAKNAAAYRGATLELIPESTKSAQTATSFGLVECAKRPEPKG